MMISKPDGHEQCSVSTGICDRLTFGRGTLDSNGYWAIPCGECARNFENANPKYGECWPTKSDTRLCPLCGRTRGLRACPCH
jgi:hypothetical protein